MIEICFVPSGSGETRGAIHWCDNRCSEHGFRFNQIGASVREEGGEAHHNERRVRQGKQPLRRRNGKKLLDEKTTVVGCGRFLEVNNLSVECGNTSLSKQHGQKRQWRMPQKKSKKELKVSPPFREVLIR